MSKTEQQSNNISNFVSPTRQQQQLETIAVSKLRHAATYNLGKDTIRNINITKNIAFHFLDHAVQCDHCALEMKKALQNKEVQN